MAVMQKLLAYLILLGVIAWIVLSYLPASIVTLPTIAFPTALNPFFQVVLIVTLALFLGLQVALVWTTVKNIQRRQQGPESADSPLSLSLTREAFWTALPIVMTIVLALASYQTWVSLTSS